MSLLQPLGLLGLLAIPVLILIYIIKSKYTEQVISSTYLWTLSERFLKRKNPIKTITGIISLILQILAVIFISIALAHPVFTLPGKANDYCFILDGSGSMNIVYDGKSRFEHGKDEIRSIINSAADGSTFTLITTGNTTDMIYKESDDKRMAVRRLNETASAYVASDFSSAAKVAQSYFNENSACKFYLVTDKEVGSAVNAEVINVAGTAFNYGVDGVSYAFNVNGGVTVSGTAFSYESDADITVDLFFDDSKVAAASKTLSLKRGQGEKFTIEKAPEEGQSAVEFRSLRVAIREKDSLSLDNQAVLYNTRSDASYNTLVVSDTPFFINATLDSAGNIKRTVVSPKDYTAEMRGYGLYIFQNFTPDKMPEDGAVWFINPDSGVDGTSGFALRGVEKFEGSTVELSMNKSSSSRVKNLLKGTNSADKTSVTEYVKCGLYRSFTTLLTCNNDPVVFAGSNSYGNREVVFAIDLVNTSDFALSYNGRVLTYNLLEYTFPSLVDQTIFYAGESLPVNVLANCSGIRVESPSGKAEYLDTSSAITDYELTEVGEYVITATVGGNRQSVRVFSQLPVAERIVTTTEASFVISGEPSEHKRDGKYEDLLYAFVILAVIVVADWLVYCYEQYQLR
ncbi:MAG: BatA and WFA domain-containing protein [Clostridia bacterium]|nr:BatA and WFA domain-containing protein [Clostridia bacterium]